MAAAIGTSHKKDKRNSDCVVLCQKQTEDVTSFCEHCTVSFRAQELIAQSFCKRLYVGELRFRFKGRYIHSHHQQILFNAQVHAANAELKRQFHGTSHMKLRLHMFYLF